MTPAARNAEAGSWRFDKGSQVEIARRASSKSRWRRQSVRPMVIPHNHFRSTDDEPTLKEEVPDFNPTRTDQIGADLARGGNSGVVEHDDRGQARWRVIPPSTGEAGRTFDELRIFDNDKLAAEDEPRTRESAPTPKSGSNPYDAGPAKTADQAPPRQRPVLRVSRGPRSRRPLPQQ